MLRSDKWDLEGWQYLRNRYQKRAHEKYFGEKEQYQSPNEQQLWRGEWSDRDEL